MAVTGHVGDRHGGPCRDPPNVLHHERRVLVDANPDPTAAVTPTASSRPSPSTSARTKLKPLAQRPAANASASSVPAHRDCAAARSWDQARRGRGALTHRGSRTAAPSSSVAVARARPALRSRFRLPGRRRPPRRPARSGPPSRRRRHRPTRARRTATCRTPPAHRTARQLRAPPPTTIHQPAEPPHVARRRRSRQTAAPRRYRIADRHRRRKAAVTPGRGGRCRRDARQQRGGDNDR